MHLSFAIPRPVSTATLSPTDLAALLAGLGERQAASATVRAQAALAATPVLSPLAPAGGAFNAIMAARLLAWKRE